MVMREKERLQFAMIKEKDVEIRQVGFFAGKVTEESVLKVVKSYYQACQFTYEPIFFAWRNKVNMYREQGLDDLTGGYHAPFMAPRGVKSMSEIKYKVNYKANSIQKYLEAASLSCRGKNYYYMNAEEDGDSLENRSILSSGSKRTAITGNTAA